MRRILLIKLTSFGDLIHALPAINDACFADPTLVFDWVIDESFSEVALWNPAVKRLFFTSHRLWRKKLFSLSTFRMFRKLIGEIRQTHYELVIDGQGNFKTAFLMFFTRGERVGFDRHSVREWIAHFAYQRRIPASKKAHAVDRLRILFSQAMGYPLPQTAPDFGMKSEYCKKPDVELPSTYLVFIHNASWKTKLWPEEHWKELIALSVRAGFQILLPWGNAKEEARARRLAIFPEVRVLPRLSLSEMGYVLQGAMGAVCMDTGLYHLAASLHVPTITLFGSTDHRLVGARGENHSTFQSTLPCSPCDRKHCKFKVTFAPCLAEITPDAVFAKLQKWKKSPLKILVN